MEHSRSQTFQGQRGSVALAALTICLSAIAHSPAIAADVVPGRIDFEAANLPEANVEVDLSQEMFHDLFGIGDAAIAGVAETLMKSADGDGGKSTRVAAEQLEMARQIIQVAGNVVREIRVRAYEGLPDEVDDVQKLIKPFEDQLRAGKWESLARVRNDDGMVRVSAIRSGGAIQGVFVVATDGDAVVIANVVCDVSPENVRKLTSAATQVGLDNGLALELERKIGRKGDMGTVSPTIVIKDGKVEKVMISAERSKRAKPPVPPVPPAPPAVTKPVPAVEAAPAAKAAPAITSEKD